jgi:DNA modification methylase
MEYLIQTYSLPNQLILDPFAGSGSTLVACKKLNRRFIGIEISEDYCAIARQRLAQGVLNF